MIPEEMTMKRLKSEIMTVEALRAAANLRALHIAIGQQLLKEEPDGGIIPSPVLVTDADYPEVQFPEDASAPLER
jgi:hypothetical protein